MKATLTPTLFLNCKLDRSAMDAAQWRVRFMHRLNAVPGGAVSLTVD